MILRKVLELLERSVAGGEAALYAFVTFEPPPPPKKKEDNKKIKTQRRSPKTPNCKTSIPSLPT